MYHRCFHPHCNAFRSSVALTGDIRQDTLL
jgi:hypothetical protein